MVAVKKFLESEEDRQVKKIAMREIKMLKHLHHENLVNLIEVFRRKKRLYLVFEYVEQTLLHEMEKHARGLPVNTVRRYLFQITTALAFCHSHNVIHRDIKPENVLVSKFGVVKLCDFGFARTLAGPGEIYTDYVATRWYRSPELLVGDPNYGTPVDVWALGCLFFEMLTADPLFPGDSDIDQIYHILKCLGPLPKSQVDIFSRNTLFHGVRLPEPRERLTLQMRLRGAPTPHAIEFLEASLVLDPAERLTAVQLLEHPLFSHDGFNSFFPEELAAKMKRANGENPLPKKPLSSTSTTSTSIKKASPQTSSPIAENDASNEDTQASQVSKLRVSAEDSKRGLTMPLVPPMSPSSLHSSLQPSLASPGSTPARLKDTVLTLPSLHVQQPAMSKKTTILSSLPQLKMESLPHHLDGARAKSDVRRPDADV